PGAVAWLAMGRGEEAPRRLAVRRPVLARAASFDGRRGDRVRPAPDDVDSRRPDGRDHAARRAAVSRRHERGAIREGPCERSDWKRPAGRVDGARRNHGDRRDPARNLRGLMWTLSETCSTKRSSIATDARWDGWTESCSKTVRASLHACPRY